MGGQQPAPHSSLFTSLGSDIYFLQPYIELDCQLGEGPFYEEATRTFRFVDIFGKKLHRFHVDKGQSSLESYDTGDAVGYENSASSGFNLGQLLTKDWSE